MPQVQPDHDVVGMVCATNVVVGATFPKDLVAHTLGHFGQSDEDWDAVGTVGLRPHTQAIAALWSDEDDPTTWRHPEQTTKRHLLKWSAPAKPVVQNCHDAEYFPRYFDLILVAGPPPSASWTHQGGVRFSAVVVRRDRRFTVAVDRVAAGADYELHVRTAFDMRQPLKATPVSGVLANALAAALAKKNA